MSANRRFLRIVQFLEVIEVPDALPWRETHRVNCRDRSSDEPIQEKQRSRTKQIIRVQSRIFGAAHAFLTASIVTGCSTDFSCIF
jgi:hypothetical protein